MLTEGTTTLTITPTNNDDEDGLKTLGVQGTLVSTGEALSTGPSRSETTEAPSTSIRLSADPNALNENASLTHDCVDRHVGWQGVARGRDVRLAIDNESTATRPIWTMPRYLLLGLRFRPAPITGTVRFLLLPVADNLEEGDEVIRLIGTIDGLDGDEVEITLSDPRGAAKAVIQTRP